PAAFAEILFDHLKTGVIGAWVGGIVHAEGDSVFQLGLHKVATEIANNWEAIKEALATGQMNDGTLQAITMVFRGVVELTRSKARNAKQHEAQVDGFAALHEGYLAEHPPGHPDVEAAHEALRKFVDKEHIKPWKVAKELGDIVRKLRAA